MDTTVEPTEAEKQIAIDKAKADKIKAADDAKRAEEAKVVEADRVEMARREAEFQAHPHTQLANLIAFLQKRKGDIHDRIAAVEQAMTRFFQLQIQHVEPPPPVEPIKPKDATDGKR